MLYNSKSTVWMSENGTMAIRRTKDYKFVVHMLNGRTLAKEFNTLLTAQKFLGVAK
jgi:hypothetical protein